MPRPVGRDVVDPRHHGISVLEPHFLPGIALVADGQFRFHEREHRQGVGVVPRMRVPDPDGRDGHGQGHDEHQAHPDELAPHADAVKNGLPAAYRVVAQRSNVHFVRSLSIASSAVRTCAAPPGAGAGRRSGRGLSGPGSQDRPRPKPTDPLRQRRRTK